MATDNGAGSNSFYTYAGPNFNDMEFPEKRMSTVEVNESIMEKTEPTVEHYYRSNSKSDLKTGRSAILDAETMSKLNHKEAKAITKLYDQIFSTA